VRDLHVEFTTREIIYPETHPLYFLAYLHALEFDLGRVSYTINRATQAQTSLF